jgi:hypothetical protein
MDSNEILDAPLIRSLDSIREKACGKFLSPPMIAHAFTTYPFPTAWITTVTHLFVFRDLALFHATSLPLIS